MRFDLAAAIVAGGRARRLGGRDKSRLLVGGRSIIDRQMAVLQPLASDIFIVADETERFRDLAVPVYPDVVAGAGALGGIYTALVRAQAPFVVAVACDLPFLDGALLGRLAERAAGENPEGAAYDGAWVRSARGPEPLLACYRRNAHAIVRRQIDAGRLQASALSDVLRIAEVGPDEAARFGPLDRLLANVNTPDDLARLE